MCVCVRFAISSNSSLCAKAKTGDNNAEKSTQSGQMRKLIELAGVSDRGRSPKQSN